MGTTKKKDKTEITDNRQENESKSSEKNGIANYDFPIVGIGASAGGLEALGQFFINMPVGTGMAFVIIQHLDPNHTSILSELLQRLTTMKVVQATDGIPINPNRVYVIPPNKSIILQNKELKLRTWSEPRGLRLPVDIFFHSLAQEMKEKSIGIILSGMGSDGSLGLKAIKNAKGMALLQDPETAKFDSMPHSADVAIIADIIAPANELPSMLMSRLRLNPSANTLSLPETADEKETEEEPKGKSNIERIILMLNEHSGHDFSLYKKNTLFRRIERRKNIHHIDKIQDYVQLLKVNPKEVDILFKELLIGVTSFFRDKLLWEKLLHKVLPDYLHDIPDGRLLRAWVPACSTGEEAYSLAITFKEVAEALNKKVSLQIFATDLDTDAIDKARKGFFKNVETEVSPTFINKYFTKEPGGYRINTSIREMIVFATQNVIKDPPFTKLDILSCRNVLIYMETELQQKLMTLFYFSLNRGGLMILGTAETIGTQDKYFEDLDSKLKIYRRNTLTLTRENFNFPNFLYHNKVEVTKEKILPKVVESIQSLADQILLQRFSPASVLINDSGDIVYITGRTGKYLEPVAGKANWNIYAMARDGLQHELPGAIRKALQNFNPVVLRNIRIVNNDTDQIVDVTVQRIEKPESIKGLVMVVFSDVASVKHEKVSPVSNQKVSLKNQKELETELQRSYEELKKTREEMHTSQEELKSINEELQSMNEELQSTNEELTTSKEEMQSLNEELQTVNIELQSKVNEQLRMNDDMKNLLNSTEIATLFLDKELNIRRYTDLVTQIFKLRKSDVGRPFTDLVSHLQYPEMDYHAKQVLRTLLTKETAITTADGKWYNIRIMPYRTLDDRIDGLVITFTDITVAKKMEMELKEANDALRRKKEN